MKLSTQKLLSVALITVSAFTISQCHQEIDENPIAGDAKSPTYFKQCDLSWANELFGLDDG